MSQESEAFRKAIQSVMPTFMVEGTVSNVDTDEMTCTVEREDDVELLGVRLSTIIEIRPAVIRIPKIGARCLCLMVENSDTDFYLVESVEYEKYCIQIGNTILELTEQGLNFKNLETSIKSILTEMVSQMAAITIIDPQSGAAVPVVNISAINAIKPKINSLFYE